MRQVRPRLPAAETESYTDVLLRDESARRAAELAPATAFVSHAHTSPFAELVGALARAQAQALSGGGGGGGGGATIRGGGVEELAASQRPLARAYFWLDIFCLAPSTPVCACLSLSLSLSCSLSLSLSCSLSLVLSLLFSPSLSLSLSLSISLCVCVCVCAL
jgi:hypothetical protein